MIKFQNNIKVYVVGGDIRYAKFIDNCEIVSRLGEADIVLFTGGEDVYPGLYGEEAQPTTYFNLDRDLYEKSVYEKVSIKQLCVGICRGAQFLAVMNGSKLVQHVSGHAITGTHNITATQNNFYYGGLDTFAITSTHHQMLRPNNSRNLRILYESTKKLSKDEEYMGSEPEIYIYNEDSRFKPACLCIQGHPEMMDSDSDAVYVCNLLIHTQLNRHGKYYTNWLQFERYCSNSKWSTDSADKLFTLPYVDTWCFGDLFRDVFYDVSQTEDYKITYHIDTPTTQTNVISRNLCLFSKNDIQIYFEKLRKIHDFRYKIMDLDNDQISGYRFDITINANVFWHKLLITLIRYVYMYPYSFILYDALQLIKNGYNNYSIMNILNIVSYTTKEILYTEEEYDFFAYGENDRQLKRFVKKEFYNNVKKYVKIVEYERLKLDEDNENNDEDDDDYDDEYNNEYDVTSLYWFNDFCNIRKPSVKFEVIDVEFMFTAKTFNIWTKRFDKRLPYYLNNFKKF